MARPGATMILVARFSFFCMEIGLAKSFGVLIPELEEQLQTSNAIIGLITSLSLATMFLGGPIAKILLHRCSHPRMLTSVCGLVAGCSLIAISFTRNIVLMGTLFINLGLCCAVINLQTLVLLHEYYQEDFPFVSCISVLGIPIGAAILPPITEKFLEHYGMSGTLLIVGALVLNMLPIGMMLKVPGTKRSASDIGIRQDQMEFDLLMVTQYRPKEEDSKEYGRFSSIQNEKSQPEPQIDSQSNRHRKNGSSSYVAIQNVESALSSQSCTTAYTTGDVMIDQHPQGGKDINEKPPTKDNLDVLLQDSSSFTKDIRPTNETSSCLSFFYFDVMIKEPLFSIFFLPSIILLFLVTGGWALFVVLYAMEHGIDIARGTYLATSGAIGGIISSVLMSVGLRYHPEWSPQYWLANHVLYAVMFFLQILHSSYIYLLVMSFLIGFGLFGVNVTIEAMMSWVIEKKNFPDASSLFCLAIGIGYISAGYISGFVLDHTGDIKLLFVFLGVMSMLGLVLISTMVIIVKRRKAGQTLDSDRVEDENDTL